MDFRNQHDLLKYLLDLGDSENRWRLSLGRDLSERLTAEGPLGGQHSGQGYTELSQDGRPSGPVGGSS